MEIWRSEDIISIYYQDESLIAGCILLKILEVVAVEWMPWLDASAESTRLLQPTLGLKHEQATGREFL